MAEGGVGRNEPSAQVSGSTDTWLGFGLYKDRLEKFPGRGPDKRLSQCLYCSFTQSKKPSAPSCHFWKSEFQPALEGHWKQADLSLHEDVVHQRK